MGQIDHAGDATLKPMGVPVGMRSEAVMLPFSSPRQIGGLGSADIYTQKQHGR